MRGFGSKRPSKMKIPVTITEIEEQIRIHEKQIALLEIAKSGIARAEDAAITADRYKRNGLFDPSSWQQRRAEVNAKITARVLRYYTKITEQFCV